MNRLTKIFFVILTLVVFLLPFRVVLAQEKADSLASVVDSQKTWYDSYDAASSSAIHNKQKHLLLAFQTEWCQWCKAMNDSTWTDAALLAMSKNAAWTRLDGDLDTMLVAKFKVRRFPTTILTTDKGVEVDRFVGYFGPRELQEEIIRAMEGQGTLWELERKLTESQNNPTVLLAMGREYLERGEPVRAMEFLGRAASADQDGGAGVADDVLFVKAQIERDDRNWYKAIEELKRLVKEYPESEWREDAELYIAWLYAMAGDNKEAQKRYNEFLESYGSSSETHWVKRQLANLESTMQTAPATAPSDPEGQ